MRHARVGGGSPMSASGPWWRRRWVSVGEAVAVAALAVAVLGYLDAHRERRVAEADRAVAARRDAAREALVLTARAVDGGAILALAPLAAGQAVQSQRYVFPTAVLDHAMEVSAAQPQIDRAWIADGLKRALAAAAPRGARAGTGEGALPVAILTSYIEEGEPRSDASLYRLGYRLEPAGLFGGRRLVLQGLSLVRHGLSAAPRPAVDAAWRAAAARPLAPVAD